MEIRRIVVLIDHGSSAVYRKDTYCGDPNWRLMSIESRTSSIEEVIGGKNYVIMLKATVRENSSEMTSKIEETW